MTSPLKCAVCGGPASFQCVACKQVYYCCKEHQKIDWKNGHKAKCKCYEIVKNDMLGRHLRATRDIKKGEIILREPPLIYGPKIACTPLCLGCHRTLDCPINNYYKCRRCTWPLCGPDCETSPQHKDECNLMASRKFCATIDYESSEQTRKKVSAYCVILPLRCMLLKQTNPAKYEKFAALEDHLQERIDTPLYKVLRVNLLSFLKTILHMEEWSEEEMLRVAARLDTNAFEVRQPLENRRVRAIYPFASMLSHDCVSNTRHTFDEQMNIILIAKRPIAKGEIISTCYTQPLKSTLMRRVHLAQAKCFDCSCKRCQDPTELNTFAGAILCNKCEVGKIISTNPMDNDAVWQCQLCPHQLLAKQMNHGNLAMSKELDSLDKSSVRAFEEFLFRYRKIFPEKNTFVLQAKYVLTQLYGNAPGYSLLEMNDAAIKRKIDLCRELLEVAEVLDSGWSIFRGNLLLDLQEALFVQTKREHLKDLLTPSAVREKFKECMELLREAIEITKLEPNMKQTIHERTQLLAKELEMYEANDNA